MGGEASLWEKHGLEARITDFLAGISSQGHRFGRPHITADQLAITFAERYPETAKAIALPIGGAGTGQRTSLAQHLALQLSRGIKADRIEQIEGAFPSHMGMVDLTHKRGEETLRLSVQG